MDGLACLAAPARMPVGNLLALPGLHEQVLNNLAARYREGLIPDFFAFFAMAWATAVFHDRFRDFLDEITSGVLSNPAVDLAEFHKAVAGATADPAGAAAALAVPGGNTLVHEKLMDFLTYNAYHLPMYARVSVSAGF